MNEQPAPLCHGGDLAAATMRYGLPAGGWIDLSTGISPFAYPIPQLDPAAWHRLPSADRLDALREVALSAYGAGEKTHVALAPGAQALIGLLPHVGGGRARVAIVSPTYSEHARAWRRDEHVVTEVTALPHAADFDIVVLTNPNNPDGRLFARDDLIALADDLGARDGLLIIDECFADVIPHRSLAGESGHRALLILRSFGKFFGLAGLRLGFALGPRRIIRRLDDLLGPWPVSGPAIEIAVRALADRAWIESARLRLVENAKRLDVTLREFGFGAVGGTPLFRLVEHPDAISMHQQLGRDGIWTRRFDYAPNWLRFGLPGSEEAFVRLDRTLATIASDIIIARDHARS